jgi:hypothetical protein
MPSIWSHARIVADIASMKMFVWVLGRLFPWAVDPNGGILDSHLVFYDRYSDLAEYHRLRGRTARADRLTAIAEAYYQAAPDDDDEPEAAAMAMPVPRPLIMTNAVSTTRVPKPREAEQSDLAPSHAHAGVPLRSPETRAALVF